MVQTHRIKTAQQPSALSKFHLSFEYDKTIDEVRRDVKKRSDKNL